MKGVFWTLSPRRAYAYEGTARDSTRAVGRVPSSRDVRELHDGGCGLDSVHGAPNRKPGHPSHVGGEAPLVDLPVLLSCDVVHGQGGARPSRTRVATCLR